MRALIVDDERLARDELRRMLRPHPEIQIVGEAANAREARMEFRRSMPELIFLDVQMPGENGFELLASLDSMPIVVFTTAYDEHAARAFEVSALDYLVKPIAPGRLARTVARLLDRSDLERENDPGRKGRGRDGLPTVATRLRHLLQRELGRGEPTLGRIAAQFHVSPRTLHRRLAKEGTTFRRLLATTRCSLAEKYLSEQQPAVGEIGYRLGFSEPSAFHRAFKRWTGQAPQSYRKSRASTR